MHMETEADNSFFIMAVGLCYASACSSLPLEEVTHRLNMEVPTGVSPWTPCEESTFADGKTNPHECPDYPGNKHYLFNC